MNMKLYIKQMDLMFGYATGPYAKSLTRDVHSSIVKNMSDFPSVGKNCAVVGTSSSLLRRKLGKQIDAHDTVIRVNSVPLLEQYNKYTGIRDDIRVSTYPMLPKESEGVRVVYYCHIPWYPSACWYKTHIDHRPRLSPMFVQQVKQSHALKKWPTTGLMAFEVANRLCEHVTLYGFGIDTSFSNCSHYYNTQPGKRCRRMFDKKLGNTQIDWKQYIQGSWHDFANEVAFFNKMNTNTGRRTGGNRVLETGGGRLASQFLTGAKKPMRQPARRQADVSAQNRDRTGGLNVGVQFERRFRGQRPIRSMTKEDQELTIKGAAI